MTSDTEEMARSLLEMDGTVPKDAIDKAMAILRGQVPDEDAPLYTVKPKDAAKLLRVSRRTVYRFLDNGILQRVYEGRTNAVGISRDSLVRMFDRMGEKRTAKAEVAR